MILPRDLQHYVNAGAVVMAAGPYPHLCPNCGGNKIVGCFLPKSGPYQTPEGRAKWLDNDKPGWYQAESHYEPCPVCRGGQVPYEVIMQSEANAQRPGVR